MDIACAPVEEGHADFTAPEAQATVAGADGDLGAEEQLYGRAKVLVSIWRVF